MTLGMKKTLTETALDLSQNAEEMKNQLFKNLSSLILKS